MKLQADMPGAETEAVERALLNRAAEGNRAALERLYALYQPRVFKFVYRLTNSYATADELVNDIMFIVWQKAGSFRGDSKVSTWIFGIAYRQTMRRVSRRKPTLSIVASENAWSGEDDVSLETEDWVRRGISALPHLQRMTVMLVFYLGLSYEETAAIADCPVNTVKTRMYHARRQLKELLERHGAPAGQRRGTPDD